MTPILQFTRLTNSSRLPDRFLVCQVKEFYEAGFDGQARLFILIEITRPWLIASQIGQALVHAFTTGYRETADEKDDIKHIEAALRRVNETLVHLCAQGETEWIGHTNAIFILEKAGEVHVAQTGRAGALLNREGKLSQITESEVSQSTSTVNRTFTNITSGTLIPGDALILSSSDFLRILPNEVLENSFKDLTAAEATNKFARILRQHQCRTAAAIIIKVYDPQKLEQEPLLTDPEVIYLDEQPIETFSSILKTLGRRIGKIILVAGHNLARINKSLDRVVRQTIAPKGKAFLSVGIKTTRDQFNNLRTKHIPKIVAQSKPILKKSLLKTNHAINWLASKTGEVAKLSNSQATQNSYIKPETGLIGKDLYTVRHYTDSTKKTAWMNLFKFLSKIRFPISVKAFETLIDKKRRPQLYIAIALLLLVILIVNIYVLRARQTEKTQLVNAQQDIDELRRRFDDAKLTLAFKKDTSVSSELTSILSELTPLTSDSPTSVKAISLKKDIEETLDGLTKAVRINEPKKIATFNNPSLLFRLGSDIVTTQSGTNKILSSPIAGELIDDRAKLIEGELIITGTKLDTQDNLIFLTKNNQAFRMIEPGKNPEPITLTSDNWEQVVSVKSFSGNLYLLDPSQNQIWKYPKKDDNYDVGSKFITDDTNVTNGIDLAIDGSVFVLTRDGKITKITRGKRDGFNFRDLPEGINLNDARAIWTDVNFNSILIVTKSSVVELSKTGQYQRRYVSNAFTDLKTLTADPTAKQAWILNGDTVYEFNLAN